MPESNDKRDLIREAYDWFKRHHTWIALAVFVTASVLQYLAKIVNSPMLVVSCGIAFLISVVERLIKIGTSIDEVLTLLRSRQAPQSLPQCMEDLHGRLKNVNRSKKVIIRHLGLDMTEAWNELKRAIGSCEAGEIHCEVLIMTDQPTELGPDAPAEMKTWCTSVKGSIDRMKQDARTLGSSFAKQKRKLTFVLRKYTGTPTVHGLTLVEPFERGYVSFASWGFQSTFEWGGDDYFTFASGSASPVDRRLRQLLGGAFDHHWSSTSTEVFVYPEPRATPQPGHA